jgi:hypothetical protein
LISIIDLAHLASSAAAGVVRQPAANVALQCRKLAAQGRLRGADHRGRARIGAIGDDLDEGAEPADLNSRYASPAILNYLN